MGVATRKMINPETDKEEELEGIRLPIFNYTGKEILPIKKWNQKVKEEIQRVKELTDGRTSGWVTSSCPEDTLYHNDDITCIKNVGAAKKQKLEEAGITTVKDLVFFGFDLVRDQTPTYRCIHPFRNLHHPSQQPSQPSQSLPSRFRARASQLPIRCQPL